MSATKRLTINDCKEIIKHGIVDANQYNGRDIVKQLFDTLHENKRLRAVMQEIIEWDGTITDATLRNFVRQGLSNKDTDHG
jgi:hypothetical protein